MDDLLLEGDCVFAGVPSEYTASKFSTSCLIFSRKSAALLNLDADLSRLGDMLEPKGLFLNSASRFSSVQCCTQNDQIDIHTFGKIITVKDA